MISAVVWEDFGGTERTKRQERVVRSLVWLVSAVVAGLVRDVVLAVPAALELRDVADQTGCGFIEIDSPGRQLGTAAGECRCTWVLALQAGFQPQGDIIQEIDAFLASAAPAAVLVLATPRTFLERLFPNRAPAVGVLAPRTLLTGGNPRGFADLKRQIKGSLQTRVQEIP